MASSRPVEEAGAGGRRPQYDVDRLLEVAVGVFIERGYDGTSMEDLARATGISKSSIYHHVESKEQLLRLAVSRALDELSVIMEEKGAVIAGAADEGSRAIDRLRYVIGRVVEVLCAELPYVTLLLRVRGNTETERWALDRRRRFDRFVRVILEQAVAEGDIAADVEPAVAERLVLGMINSLTEWYRPGRIGVDELREAVVTMSMHGLQAPGPAAQGLQRGHLAADDLRAGDTRAAP
jgi:AcrR family transcriptional regulator